MKCYGHQPQQDSGRPTVGLTEIEADELRRRYVKSNRARGVGSMTYAARSAAKDPKSALSDEVREAILANRCSKHVLPVDVRRACRGVTGDGAVLDYRDKDTRRLGGMYTPGMLRMVQLPDGSSRRLLAGERQSWDDASINFCVAIPWPKNVGDKCADRWGCRAARFQLLAGIDDAWDYCVGWGYVIRHQDSYRAADVVAAVGHSWRDVQPQSVMFEGGAWQAARTVDFLQQAGVELISAKGRPHNKLIEGYWNRLWTPMSEKSGGQIGRYRGEMKRENELLMKCQAGSLDPRRVFPDLEQALQVIAESIDFLQGEPVESANYGTWVPVERYQAEIAERMAAGEITALTADYGHLVAREREKRVVHREMVKVSALSPIGNRRVYHFALPSPLWERAPVWVAFDPFEARVTAHISLVRRWKDFPAGYVVAERAECMDAYPRISHQGGVWMLDYADGFAASERAKRLANATVRRELREMGLGGKRVAGKTEIVGVGGTAEGLSIGAAQAGAVVAFDGGFPGTETNFEAAARRAEENEAALMAAGELVS
jgi:hypothetical protein